MKLDAIIVGGSFAGLAVATRLRGKILLVEIVAFGERLKPVFATVGGAVGSLIALVGSLVGIMAAGEME